MKQVMVDLETLGNRADAAIISIGAVKFDLDYGVVYKDRFYASVTLESNLALGRRVQEDTLQWWMAQSEDARKVFTEPKMALADALQAFRMWIGDERVEMWANGADFDLPMLSHAYHQVDLGQPWKFWDSRCFRTFKNLPGTEMVNLDRQGTHHNAADDADYQAQLCVLIHRALFGGGV